MQQYGGSFDRWLLAPFPHCTTLLDVTHVAEDPDMDKCSPNGQNFWCPRLHLPCSKGSMYTLA